MLDFQYSGGCQLGIKAAEDTLNSYELLQECRISGQMFMKGFFKPYNLILNRPTLERSIQKDVLRVVAVSKTNPGMDELATALESCDCLTWRRVSTISDGEATEHKVNLQSSCQTVPLVAWFMTGVTFYWHPVLLPAMVRIRFASARERNKKLVDWNEMNPQETKDPTHRCKLTRSKLEKYLDVFGFLSFKAGIFRCPAQMITSVRLRLWGSRNPAPFLQSEQASR